MIVICFFFSFIDVLIIMNNTHLQLWYWLVLCQRAPKSFFNFSFSVWNSPDGVLLWYCWVFNGPWKGQKSHYHSCKSQQISWRQWWLKNSRYNEARVAFCKFSFFEKATKICAIFMSKPWGRLRKFLWPSQKSWTLTEREGNKSP